MTPPAALIHVVDDDTDHLAALSDLLDAAGHAVMGFTGGAEALSAAALRAPDAVVTDLRMPGMDGMALLAALREAGLAMPVVMLTGHGDVQHAVRAMRAGAEDFLEKPYDAAHLLAVLARGLETAATRSELLRLQTLMQLREAHPILGESAAMSALRDRVAALAPLDVNVVVTGETGTGKELVARALHAASPRAGRPYVAINCAALPEALFEIEMFGHAAGAFPGAQSDKAGKLEAAGGGTLVLDEVEALAPALQANSCAHWKNARSNAWARTACARLICASSPRRRPTCPHLCAPAACAPIFTGGWRARISRPNRCARWGRTSS